jgi:hypothetical protein
MNARCEKQLRGEGNRGCPGAVQEFIDGSLMRLCSSTSECAQFSIGGRCSQIHNRGEKNPVGYYSCRLNAPEQNYATYDKELLGLRGGVLHFRHYLLGIKFKVHTDHSAVRWFMSQPDC